MSYRVTIFRNLGYPPTVDEICNDEKTLSWIEIIKNNLKSGLFVSAQIQQTIVTEGSL